MFDEAKIVETDVDIATPDGTSDAVLFHPEGQGAWPAVLVWTDILGLRPVFRDMGRRLAAQGYVVLVPNPFYRTKRAPTVDGPVDFTDPVQRGQLMSLMATLTPAAAASDAKAYIAYLDAQPQTDKAKKAGVQGYCMGGSLSVRTAAAVPDRIGAVGSFHGGNGMVSDKPESVHLLIPQTKASFLVGAAQNDDAQQPEIKDLLKAAFDAAGRPATVEVYKGDHGWCVKGGHAYDEAEAERAWANLLKLYKSALV